MRFAVLILLVLWMHMGDLASAWLYGGGAWPDAVYLRHLRDLLVILTAGLCLLSVRFPTRLMMPMLAYGGTALAYLLLNRGDAARGIQLGSFGTLMIPMLFFLAGYYCIRERRQLHLYAALLAALGIASTLFGVWERQHTDFWIETLAFPRYMLDIKGMVLGANFDTGMPWNFYGVELSRRAAGLLASPLAQGMFLAVAALVSLAWLERRARWLGLILGAIMFTGIWMSGTRGAMLAGSLSLVGYLASSAGLFRNPAARLLLAGCTVLAVAFASYGIVIVSVNFLDGSTIGHWTALKKNMQDLPGVLLFGAGLGQQGAVVAQQSMPTIGGGEGAIFSIAFQLGVPAALFFIWFYGQCTHMLWRGYRQHREPISLAACWLAIGIATTLVSSEHVLTVSGTGAFWLLCGGALRSLPKPSTHAVEVQDECQTRP